MERNILERLHYSAVAAGLVGALALGGCANHEFASGPENTTTTTAEMSATTDPMPADSELNEDREEYVMHDNITASLFWIGESADSSNDYISNVPMAWDENAAERYGGYDGSPEANSGFYDVPRNDQGIVTEFAPKHNPYYFALPAGEFDENGLIAGARERSPWANEVVGDDESLFKGRWIEVTAGDNTVFAQWLDVGPNEEQDYDYVFGDGSQQPKNSFGLHAGIDLSPATAAGIGFTDGGIKVSWRFVDAADVPDGPWTEYPAINNKTYWG